LANGEIGTRHSRARRSQSYAFVAGDGLPLGIHLSSPPKFWQGLANAVGHPELLEDPRFKTKDERVRNYEALHDVLAEIFAQRPRAAWMAALEANDVPAAPINDIAEALADPQAQHVGMVQTFGQAERATPLVGFPVTF